MTRIKNKKDNSNKTKGFTLIELLVVIAIIALLSSVVMAGLSDARVKARNARREMDMTQIYNALNLFYDKYGCLPAANSKDCAGFSFTSDSGGWDSSYDENSFLTFLVASGFLSKVPVDPINERSSSYFYSYYCYKTSYYGNKGLVLQYIEEKSKKTIYKNNKITGVADSTFLCK